MKSRLFYKLFGGYLAIVTLTVAILGTLISGVLKTEMTARIEKSLLTHARIIALMPVADIETRLFALARQSGTRITLIDAKGMVIMDSENNAVPLDNHLNRPEIQQARLKGEGVAVRYSHTLGIDMLYGAVLMGDAAQPTGYIRLARPLFEMRNAVTKLSRSIYKTIGLTMIPVLLLTFFFARKIVRPIREIELYAEKVSRGEAAGTLIIDTTDEIGSLGENLNHLVVALQEQIRAVSEEKGILHAAFSSMGEGVLILGSDNRIETTNRGLTDILGDKYRDIIHMTPMEAFRNVALKQALEQFQHMGGTLSCEIVIDEVPPVTLSVTISPVEGLPGGEQKTILVFHDVTRLKKLEEVRADFVANVTHEIKTPLTAIIGFTETLLESGDTDRETERKLLYTINQNALRLNRLVDDLLVLSAIEMGETELHLEEIPFREILEHTIALVKLKADEKGLTLRTVLPEAPPVIWADRDKVIQIMLNILDNAIKYTPPKGEVSVMMTDNLQDGYAAVRVADTGLGIPRNEIPRLGERFYRVDKARSREQGGTGLGLSIVKHLMKLLKGRMEIESTPGRGTAVTLYFPVAFST